MNPFFINAAELINSKQVPSCDFHIHTNYADGKASVKEVFEKAISIGLDAIAFTEHTETWHHSDDEWFIRYYNEIEHNKNIFKGNIKAFIGIEAPAISFNGDIEASDEMITKVDFILGAAHRYPNLGNRKVKELSLAEAVDMEYKTLMGLIQSENVDVIAHIGATCSKYCGPFPKHLSREIICEAVKNHKIIEVNPVYHKPLKKFIELCAKENAKICLGSNAHGFNDIGLIVREIKKLYS